MTKSIKSDSPRIAGKLYEMSRARARRSVDRAVKSETRSRLLPASETMIFNDRFSRRRDIPPPSRLPCVRAINRHGAALMTMTQAIRELSATTMIATRAFVRKLHQTRESEKEREGGRNRNQLHKYHQAHLRAVGPLACLPERVRGRIDLSQAETR